MELKFVFSILGITNLSSIFLPILSFLWLNESRLFDGLSRWGATFILLFFYFRSITSFQIG